MDLNLLLDTDSYKLSHWLQYPGDLTAMGAYLESRGGENPETLFFGLQMLLQQSLTTPITHADVEEAIAFWHSHGLPFNRQGWERVVKAAQGGQTDALKHVGHNGTPETHPVCQAIQARLGAGRRRIRPEGVPGDRPRPLQGNRRVKSPARRGSDRYIRSRGTAQAATSTATSCIGPSRSFITKTEISTAKTALVSRNAAEIAIGAWEKTHTIRK